MYIHRIAEKTLTELTDKQKIILILGARQVGKTTFIEHFLKDKKAVFINFDIEVDKNRFLAAASLSPEQTIKSFGNPDFIVIDEAQRISNTAQIVKGWFDAKIKTKIILLGSSSLNLLDQSAESLTGRNEKIFLPPLVFQELIENQSWYSDAYKEKLITHFSAQIQSHLLQTIVFGFYPEAVLTDNKQKYLLNLVSDYLFKDILQFGLIKTPDLLKKLLMLLAFQTGSEVSVNEIAQNIGVSRITVERYLNLLEQTFVIFRLPSFSTNPRKEINKNHKIYFWDNGIRNALLNDFSENPMRSDIGKLWENWVISEFAKHNLLSGQTKNLFFWRSRSGSEVDLVVKEGEKINAYEIKWKKRKITNRAFSQKYGVPVKLVDSSNPFVVDNRGRWD